MQETQNHTNHIPRIDVLRAVAILLVFSSHFYTAVYGLTGYFWNGLWYHWTDHPSVVAIVGRFTIFDGSLGVALFFVISGLCIRLSHRASNRFSVTFFYWRRFWRIYPPYLLALLLFVGWQGYKNFEDIISHVFLVHNFWPAYTTSINGPFWSLALEFQVYLLYPVLLFLHNRFGSTRTGILLASLSIASITVGGETFRHHFHLPDSFQFVRKMPTLLWFTWYTGFLLAEAIIAKRSPSLLSRAVLIIGLALIPLCRLYRPMGVFESVVTGLVLTLLVWEFLNSKPRVPKLGQMLGCLGACSYSFYLYFDQLINPILHSLPKMISSMSAEKRFLVAYPVTLFAIFAASYALYRTIEMGSLSIGSILRNYLKALRSAKVDRR